MSSLMQGRVYRLGETVQYGSIYAYRKNRVALLDAATGDHVGWIKEEVVPGLPGQPDLTCYYEKNGWRPSGKLRFRPYALTVSQQGITRDSNDSRNFIWGNANRVSNLWVIERHGGGVPFSGLFSSQF